MSVNYFGKCIILYTKYHPDNIIQAVSQVKFRFKNNENHLVVENSFLKNMKVMKNTSILRPRLILQPSHYEDDHELMMKKIKDETDYNCVTVEIIHNDLDKKPYTNIIVKPHNFLNHYFFNYLFK